MIYYKTVTTRKRAESLLCSDILFRIFRVIGLSLFIERTEIVTGVDSSKHVSVDRANSIEFIAHKCSTADEDGCIHMEDYE
jgi:hypothetical protein